MEQALQDLMSNKAAIQALAGQQVPPGAAGIPRLPGQLPPGLSQAGQLPPQMQGQPAGLPPGMMPTSLSQAQVSSRLSLSQR